jgi:hypothetical protein
MNAGERGVPVVAGPLAGYGAAFRAHLSRSGYTPLSARDLLRAMARAGPDDHPRPRSLRICAVLQARDV